MGIYRFAICPACNKKTKVKKDDRKPSCKKCSGLLKLEADWWIDFYAQGRRKRKKIGPSYILAEQILAKYQVEIAENKYLDIRKDQKIKFEDFADEFVEVYLKPNVRSWKKAQEFNVEFLKKFFRGKHLHEITPFLVEKLKIERAQTLRPGVKRVKTVAPATVNKTLMCLKSIFSRAISWGKFSGTNPVKEVKFFKEANSRLRYLEKEEIVKLLQYCRGTLKPVVIVALNTGMRRGEILNLKWTDLDFRRGIIYLYQTKNNEKREIPMNETVKTAFIRVRKHPDSPFIFCDKHGQPFYNLRTSFFTACKKAGIINFRFHDLRHTFASQLVMSGVDLNTVRELLGHKSLEMTLRYSHLSPDHKKRAVDTLGRRMDTFWTPSAPETKEAVEGVDATHKEIKV